METLKYKYGVLYTDGGYRDRKPQAGAGCGIHGFLFNELPSVRFSKVPVLVTPKGYEPKLTGAQLKDENYDPEYSQWGYSLTAKAGKVVTEGADIKIIDCFSCLGNVSAQRGELEAFLHVVENPKLDLDYITFYSDSNYLVLGISRDLKNWKANNWCKRDNSPIGNHDLWVRIDEALEDRGDTIEVLKIKAHEGHYGNEAADRNATMGVAGSCSANSFEDWIVTDIHDIDYFEPEKPLPIMLQQKWCYTLTETERRGTEIDGEPYMHYFMGDHNDSKDDIELLGKMSPSAGFSLVMSKPVPEVLDKVKEYHVANMWKHNCNMYKSELMMMLNCANIIKPKNIWELKRGRHECLFISGSLNDLSAAKTEDLVSKVIRPPLLSFRVLDIEEEFRNVLTNYLVKTGHDIGDTSYLPYNIVINDVTDEFYETPINAKGVAGATKLGDLYDQMAKALPFQVNHTYNDKKAKVILTRGIDLPSRSIMSKVASMNPKVSIVTWQFDEIMINFGFVLECDEGVGIWSGYASTRTLGTHEQ